MRQSTKVKGITNVILVKNTSLNQDLLRDTSREFMKDKEITNVNSVENPSVDQEL